MSSLHKSITKESCLKTLVNAYKRKTQIFIWLCGIGQLYDKGEINGVVHLQKYSVPFKNEKK